MTLTEQLRHIIGIDVAIDMLEKLYDDAFEKYKTTERSRGMEAHFFSSYLRGISLLVKQKDQEIVDRILIIQQKEREINRISQKNLGAILLRFMKRCAGRARQLSKKKIIQNDP